MLATLLKPAEWDKQVSVTHFYFFTHQPQQRCSNKILWVGNLCLEAQQKVFYFNRIEKKS